MNRDEYAAYRASDHWREFSRNLRYQEGACEECGITDTLNVHHKNYNRLGHEQRSDVQVLCERCHHNTHILEQRMKMFGIKDYISGTFIEKRDAVCKIIERVRAERSSTNQPG